MNTRIINRLLKELENKDEEIFAANNLIESLITRKSLSQAAKELGFIEIGENIWMLGEDGEERYIITKKGLKKK